MAQIAGVNDEFTQWFVAQVQEIHGFDLRQVANQPGPEMAIDSGPYWPRPEMTRGTI